MRILHIAISLLLLQLHTAAQTVTIKGVIESRPDMVIRFSYPEDPVNGSIEVSEVTTDKNGTFTTTFALNRKRTVRIDFNIPDSNNNPHPLVNYLWIEPGKLLQVTIKADTSLFYAGQCVQENNTLKAIGLNGAVDYQSNEPDFNAFCKKADRQKNEQLSILAAAAGKYKFSSEFLNYTKTEIVYYNYRRKFQFINNYPGYDPSVITKFLRSVNLLSDAAFYSPKFRNGLSEYIDIITMRSMKDSTESYILRVFRQMDQTLTHHAKTKEYLKAYLLKFMFAYEQNIDTLKEAVAAIENDNPKCASLPYFYKRIDEKISLLYAGRNIPDFTLMDINRQPVSLKSFGGRILFIDFWGSWCKPCMEEMPYSIKLHQELDSSKVLFIYINNPADSYEKWVETVNRLGLKGINLKADTETQKLLTDYYVFTNYPFYVVHDLSGRPVNIEGGIRPSGNAREVLLSLMNGEKKEN